MRKIIPVLLAVALVGCSGSPGQVTVASGGDQPLTTLPQETTTTTGASTTTTAAPVTTTTTRPPDTTTSTTRPTATTTTRPAARTITVTATPGQYYSDALVKGAGCAGPQYGVTLEIRDPTGQPIDGDGGLASADGTWELHELFGSNRPPGQYSFHARCIVSNGPDVFAYAPQTFAWAG